MNFLKSRLEERRASGLLRRLCQRTGGIDLTSNDYFGFAREEREERGCAGAGGSRLLSGNSVYYEELEKRLARFHRAESCLIYTSGYLANQGLLAAIGVESATFIYDLEIHASMIDGMRLSEAKCVPFRHNDLASLEKRLQRASLPVFILIESLYSISGDLAPLAEIARLSKQYGAELIVDEAHATGLFGAGLAVEIKTFARVCTFSQALGVQGACILGSSLLREYLINFSRPFIYTTAFAQTTLRQISRSYDKLEEDGEKPRQALFALIAYFCEKTGRGSSLSPIQPIFTAHSLSLSQKLWERGIDVRSIRSPTVGRGKECLRVVLHSFNQPSEIDQLLECL